jgi:hypothetical protein
MLENNDKKAKRYMGETKRLVDDAALKHLAAVLQIN